MQWEWRRIRHEASIQAVAIYLLTRNEEVTTNYVIKLRDSLAAMLPPGAWHGDPTAAWLAATWRLLKKEDEAQRLIALHLPARRTWNDEWRWYYESRLTREAMSFTVLCRHFPEIAGRFGYDDLRPLTEMLERGDFHTLSAAWCVQAFKSYAALAKNSDAKAGIRTTAGDLLAEPVPGVVSAKMPPAAAGARFLLSRPAGAPVIGAWYQLIETGFDRALPAEPETQGIEVRREFLDVDGNPVAALTVGDTVRVRVHVRNLTTQTQPHIALGELLPGGFDFSPQAEQGALRPGLGTMEGTDYVDMREDRALLYCGLQAGEERAFTYPVRAVCAGVFAVPPAFAESMYDRAVHGRGVAGKITVLPRE